jgi:phosphoribosylformylglycinamidine cyclo-ligase
MESIAQDALIMNIDDYYVGATDNILLSTIGRNKNLITADVISAISMEPKN